MRDLKDIVAGYAIDIEELAGKEAQVTVIVRHLYRPDLDLVSTRDSDLDAAIALLEQRKIHEAKTRARALALARAM